jgi:hypothetical protein
MENIDSSRALTKIIVFGEKSSMRPKKSCDGIHPTRCPVRRTWPFPLESMEFGQADRAHQID